MSKGYFTYFIHYHVIVKIKNLFHGKRFKVLAKFDVKVLPYEKVSYTNAFINSIPLSELKVASYLISKACHWNLN